MELCLLHMQYTNMQKNQPTNKTVEENCILIHTGIKHKMARVALKYHRHPQCWHFLTQVLDFANQHACQKSETLLQKVNTVLKDRITEHWVIACTQR